MAGKNKRIKTAIELFNSGIDMLTAKDIMTKNVITVTKNLLINDLSELFIKHRINGFPVLDENGKLAGVVTEKNLIDQNKNLHMPTVITLFDAVIYLESHKKFEEEVKKFTGTRVEDIYQPKVSTVSPDASLSDVASLMANEDIQTLPVVDNGNLAGIIGKIDLIKGLAKD